MPYNKEEGRGTQMKRRPMRRRKKVCVYCVDKNAVIDYKDTNKLKRYIRYAHAGVRRHPRLW